MSFRRWFLVGIGGSALLALTVACSSGDDTNVTPSTDSSAQRMSTGATSDTEFADLFDTAALADEIQVVDCTLENGSETTCHEITVHSIPTTVEPGPFCPSTIDDESSGIFDWDGEDPGLYALNQEFWDLVDGQGYSFVNADGTVNVTDPGSGPPPTGDSCLEATPDDSYTLTALVPVTPEMLESSVAHEQVSQVGIALDGVTIFGDAPSGTSGQIPALDPCGGHYDPSGYYHWHFGSESIQTNLDDANVPRTCNEHQDDEELVGFSYDGYPVYGPLENGEVPGDLDECNGRTSDTEEFGVVYHYYLTLDSPNLPPCHVGAFADDNLTSHDNPDVSLPGGSGTGGATSGAPPPPGGAP